MEGFRVKVYGSGLGSQVGSKASRRSENHRLALDATV